MQDTRPAAFAPRARGREPARLAACVALAFVALVAAWRAPQAVRDLDGQARELAGVPPEQRDLRGARSADVDTRVFVEARRRIPPDATYAVVTGPNVEVSVSVTLDAVAPFARYYLLPRRQVPYASEAEWVLSFGGDLDALGIRLADRYAVAPGIDVARVAR